VRTLLGDTVARDYAEKLRLFNAFAEPELRQAIGSLGVSGGMQVLDAGCGSGEALPWLSQAVGPKGLVVGLDLARAHVIRSRSIAPKDASVIQADVTRLPLRDAQFDLVWCVNTLNHVEDTVAAAKGLAALLRSKGRLAIGQSSFLPDMYFAWDERLEHRTNEAVRAYYRDRYGLTEMATTGIRGLVGTLRLAGLKNVSASTFTIERVAPLASADRTYLYEAIFRDTWGERLRKYLSASDFDELERLCNPLSADFALSRPDFHFLQTFTLVLGSVAT
jgi:ubiquinone/menaquinone biosynthesis C-methylase UbiE